MPIMGLLCKCAYAHKGVIIIRKRKQRYCRRLDSEKVYKPLGSGKEEVSIALDEFEVLRLCDYEELSQIEASEEMKISRATVQRLLKSARFKVVDALLYQKTINIKNETENIRLKGENKMNNDLTKKLRIAFPTSDEVNVDEHFGHCKHFIVYTVENGKILNTELLETPKHAPGVFPNFLASNNVNTIITGGMGRMAIELFKTNNIEVILGARGNIIDNLNEYLGGTLESSGDACNHHHNDDCDH